MVSDSDLVIRLQEILRHSDLDTATAGSVRRQLEEDLGIDLSDRKSFVRDQIDIFLETLNRENEKQVEEKEAGEEEEEEDDDEESKGGGSKNTRRGSKANKQVKKRVGGFKKVCSLSPQLQTVMGESQLPRTEVVKKLWLYIRENNLQDPKNKRNILCDEPLRAIFCVNSINMFQMNKALSKHIWPLSAEYGNLKHEIKCENNIDSVSADAENAEEKDVKEDKEEEVEEQEEEEDEEENREGEEEEEKEENKEGKMKQEDREVEDEEEEEEEGDDEEEPEHNARGSKNKRAKADKDVKRRGGFTKPCSLSPELQAFLGEPELARTEVVKRLWTYIREKNLQDPMDKRNILCDESLHTIFRVNSINMFQMNKTLSKHIWPLNNEGAQAGSANSERKPKQVREEAQAGSANSERKPKQVREEGGDEPKKKDKRQKKGVSGFLTPLPLSDALVNFFGTGEIALPRADVVKRMWDYIKQNDLQDPSDRRRILCDDKLKELFELESFNGFSVTKLLTAHFIKMEEENRVRGEKKP